MVFHLFVCLVAANLWLFTPVFLILIIKRVFDSLDSCLATCVNIVFLLLLHLCFHLSLKESIVIHDVLQKLFIKADNRTALHRRKIEVNRVF